MKETYVIRERGTRYCKIGYSESTPKRMNDLQSGNPRQLEVVTVFEGDVERKLHGYFREHHVKGEWFLLPEDDIRELSRTQRQLASKYHVDEWCARYVGPGEKGQPAAWPEGDESFYDAQLAELRRLIDEVRDLRSGAVADVAPPMPAPKPAPKPATTTPVRNGAPVLLTTEGVIARCRSHWGIDLKKSWLNSAAIGGTVEHGPPFSKINGRRYYRTEDVDGWIEAKSSQATA